MLRKLIRVWIIGIVFPLYAIAGQPSVKITHGPYLQNLSENEVTVVWTTDKPCKSWVEFSKKEDGKSFYSQLPRKAYASQDGLCCVDTLHRVTVTGLEKNTTYFYRVLSQEVKELLPYRPVLGNIVSTDIWKKPLTFTTLDGRQETLSMVMINDIHGKNDLQKKLLEMALNHIAQNTETADEFLNGITELMQELVARYQAISEEKKEQFQGKAKGEVIGKCPRCGADVREGKVNFYCSDRNCAFTLWKNDKFLASQGKKMDKAAAKKFLSKGKIHYKDLVSRKTGRQYEATVEMIDPGEGNVQFNLIFPQR